MDFVNKLKELREQNKYTKRHVAKCIGISEAAYYKYEAGKARPEYENLIKLAKLYDVSLDYLLGNQEV